MSGLVFGEVEPSRYIVPESECMECRHPVDEHSVYDRPGCRYGSCVCSRSFCWLHDALDEEHECDEEDHL